MKTQFAQNDEIEISPKTEFHSIVRKRKCKQLNGNKCIRRTAAARLISHLNIVYSVCFSQYCFSEMNFGLFRLLSFHFPCILFIRHPPTHPTIVALLLLHSYLFFFLLLHRRRRRHFLIGNNNICLVSYETLCEADFIGKHQAKLISESHLSLCK